MPRGGRSTPGLLLTCITGRANARAEDASLPHWERRL